ncbi:MAG: ABC transporter permease [Thermoleophilia bacterium]|nr:ABC transporter permease [Thermoleophilia bacterium]
MSVRRVALLLRKDLIVLRRSPLLLGAALGYPLLVAVLVALVAGYAGTKPRVALVDEDGLPDVVRVGAQDFRVERAIRRAGEEVRLVRLSYAEARRQLETGRVIALVRVPEGFVDDLRGMVESPTLELETGSGPFTGRVVREVQALVYTLNRRLQRAYIEANLDYVDLLLRGGSGSFLGRPFEVLGLERSAELLRRAPPSQEVEQVRDFVGTARLALEQTDDALRATANPIELVRRPDRGRTWAFSAQVQAYALTLTVGLLSVLIAAGSLSAERDENVVGRLARGLAGLGEFVAAKIALAALVSLALGLLVFLAFGVAVELGGVRGGQPWSRLPVVAVGLVLAGAALGGLGAFVAAVGREARTALLVAVALALPLAFLALVPSDALPAAGWVGDAFPVEHSVRFFSAALYEPHPWRELAVEGAWLAAIGAALAGLTRAAARRLLV